eukprot:12182708-Alexandrium_andersonii.AAC.1
MREGRASCKAPGACATATACSTGDDGAALCGVPGEGPPSGLMLDRSASRRKEGGSAVKGKG